MRSVVFKVVIGSILTGSIVSIISISYFGLDNDDIYDNPKKYCYSNFKTSIDPALYVASLKDKDKIINYYEAIISDSSDNPAISFDKTAIPIREPVYVMGYSDDSTMVKVTCIYDRGIVFETKTIKGWVYFKTLHDSLPEGNVGYNHVDLEEVIRQSEMEHNR